MLAPSKKNGTWLLLCLKTGSGYAVTSLLFQEHPRGVREDRDLLWLDASVNVKHYWSISSESNGNPSTYMHKRIDLESHDNNLVQCTMRGIRRCMTTLLSWLTAMPCT
jgi:hypothetical protein